MEKQRYDSCIEACIDCAAACDRCASACLNEPNTNTMRECIRLDWDCAAICRLAAQLMAGGSRFADEVCASAHAPVKLAPKSARSMKATTVWHALKRAVPAQNTANARLFDALPWRFICGGHPTKKCSRGVTLSLRGAQIGERRRNLAR